MPPRQLLGQKHILVLMGQKHILVLMMPCSKKPHPTDEMITLPARAAAPHVTWQLKNTTQLLLC
jgi:hypothetical protein